MNRTAARANLLHAVRAVTALFKAAHDYERGLSAVEAALKAHSRDEREPGRDEKEAAESRLARLLRRYWERQAERIQERLVALAPDRKAVFDPRIDDFDDIFDVYRDEDADLLLALAELFADGARGGITLFAETSPVQIDWSLTNSRAAEWARGYAFDLVRGINDTTRQVLRDTISAFVDTPGMTLGQVVDSLPFDRDRAEMVATTEITRAYAEGNMQAGQAMREEFPDVRVVKVWYTSADDLVCPICSPLNGVEVDLDKPFSGTIDKPPAHPRCVLPGNEVVAPGAISAATKSSYSGTVIEISLTSGRYLTVTPNHPILTGRGWVRAQDITQFDYVFSSSDPQRMLDTVYPHNDNRPAAIEKIFSSLEVSGKMASISVPVSPIDFHGDGRQIDGNIDIVYMDGFLRDETYAISPKHILELGFGRGAAGASGFNSQGASDFILGSLPHSADGVVSFRYLGGPLFRSHSRPFEGFGFGLSAGSDSVADQPSMEGIPADTNLARQFIFRFSSFISPDPVLRIREFYFSDHVYDLQANDYELYICNGIITHNCRCWMDTRTRING